MAGLGFPRQWFGELIIDGSWQPLETSGQSDVRQTDPITMIRGRNDEQPSMPPSTLAEVLDNTGGKYTQGNVFSPLYGHLGENTPVRNGLLIAADTFSNRTLPTTLGTSTSGEVWNNAVGGSNTWSVGSGMMTHGVTAVNSGGNAYSTTLVKDCYVKLDYIPSVSNITGGDVEVGPVFRRRNAGADFYYGRVVITTGEQYQLQIWRNKGGVFTMLSSSPYTVPGLVHTAGQAVSIAGAIEGRVLMLKIWLASSPEPYEWQHIASDGDDENAIDEPGAWGVRGAVTADNTNAMPFLFGHDNVDVRIFRIHGELTSLMPWWNENHTVKVASLNASDVWQRLRRSNASVRSAMRRAIDTDDDRSLNYWPCEDEGDSDQIASGVDGAPTMFYKEAVPDFASFTGFVCSAPMLQLNLAELVGMVPAYTYTGEIMTRFLCFVPQGGSADGAILHRIQLSSGAVWRWDIKYNTSFAGLLSVQAYDFANNLIFDTLTALKLDGFLMRVQFQFKQNGANIDWTLAVLEVGASSGGQWNASVSSRTFGQVAHVAFNPTHTMDQVAIGHVTIHSVITTLFDFYQSLQGFVGETTGRRFLRNCLENGITGAVWGNPDEGAPMGAQRVDTLAGIFDLIAATEQGPVFSARSFNGLILRMRHTLHDQQPTLTLDYSAGHVAPPFTPAPDDNGRRNDVTAKRVDGSSFRSVQETGPKNAGRPWEDPEAIGPIDGDVTVNTQTDEQLRDVADFELRLGTAPEIRYPQITVDLAAPDITTVLLLAVLAVNIGDRIVVTKLTAADMYEDVDQICQGYTELSPNQQLHRVVFNATQYSPYDTMVLDVDYLDGDVVLAENVDTSETAIDFNADVLASTDVADYPQACRINGEEMTVTAVSGASFPQTMTVVRGVNTGGVGLTHLTGDVIQFIPTSFVGR